MRTTLWMATLLGAGALYAGTAMAVNTPEVTKQASQQEVVKPGQNGALAGGDSDACPIHNKNTGQKNVLGKEGEQCSCPHEKMHMHHMKHMGKNEMCDPAKAAVSQAK